LKLASPDSDTGSCRLVAPRAGARIETAAVSGVDNESAQVAPRAGARIETWWTHRGHSAASESPLAQGRGLKQDQMRKLLTEVAGSRPSRRGAD